MFVLICWEPKNVTLYYFCGNLCFFLHGGKCIKEGKLCVSHLTLVKWSIVENSVWGGGRAADNLVSTNYRSICHNMSLIALTNMSIIESLLSTRHRQEHSHPSEVTNDSWKHKMPSNLWSPWLPSLMPHHDLVSAEIESVRTDMIRINELFTRLQPAVIRLWTFYTRHHVTTLQSHMLIPTTTNNCLDAQTHRQTFNMNFEILRCLQ